MTEPDLLHAAVDELYSSPMTEFVARRKALAAAARKNGDKQTATAIAALRKPTLSADTLNHLVRSAPDEVDELLQLGTDLRQAEKELNGPALRALSGRRKTLVADLTRLAFDLTEQPNPSPSIREEVAATLGAALADERVADLIISGTLVTQARWDGFGSTSLPELATVLPLRRARTPSAERPSAPRTPTDGRPAPDPKPAPAAAPDGAAAAERVRRERDQRVAAAQQEADDAEAAAADAATRVAAIDRRIDELTAELAEQRRLLTLAQKASRSADIRRRAARLALTRVGGRLSS